MKRHTGWRTARFRPMCFGRFGNATSRITRSFFTIRCCLGISSTWGPIFQRTWPEWLPILPPSAGGWSWNRCRSHSQIGLRASGGHRWMRFSIRIDATEFCRLENRALSSPHAHLRSEMDYVSLRRSLWRFAGLPAGDESGHLCWWFGPGSFSETESKGRRWHSPDRRISES